MLTEDWTCRSQSSSPTFIILWIHDFVFSQAKLNKSIPFLNTCGQVAPSVSQIPHGPSPPGPGGLRCLWAFPVVFPVPTSGIFPDLLFIVAIPCWNILNRGLDSPGNVTGMKQRIGNSGLSCVAASATAPPEAFYPSLETFYPLKKSWNVWFPWPGRSHLLADPVFIGTELLSRIFWLWIYSFN